MDNLTIKYKIWIENNNNNGILGDGKWQLLKSIQELGSLEAAMNKHNLSYRKTWNNLKKIERALGFPIIQRYRGGKDGGHSSLSPQGYAIVKAFDEFHNKYDKLINEGLEETLNEIKKNIDAISDTKI